MVLEQQLEEMRGELDQKAAAAAAEDAASFSARLDKLKLQLEASRMEEAGFQEDLAKIQQEGQEIELQVRVIWKIEDVD